MTVDPKNLKKIAERGTQDIAFCITRQPNSSTLFVGNSSFQVVALQTDAEKPEFQPLTGESHQSYVTGITVGGDSGNVLVSGAYDGRLIWWDPQERKSVRVVEAHPSWIRGVVASPDGKLIASVADDMVCRLWDANSGEAIRSLEKHARETPHHYPSMLYAAAFSPNGQFLATADRIGHVIVWEVATGKVAGELDAPVMYTWDPRQRRHSIGGIRSVAFSPDGKRIAVGGIGKIGNIDHLGGPSRVEIFQWESGERLHEIEDDKLKGLVERLHFSDSGHWLLAAGGDHGGFLSFYNTETGKLIHQEKAPMHVHDFVFDDQGEKLYTAGHNKLVEWSLTESPDE